MAKTLKALGLVISSAHISTFGERVVDVFYVKDVFGLKITQTAKLTQIRKRLASALEQGETPAPAQDANTRSAA